MINQRLVNNTNLMLPESFPALLFKGRICPFRPSSIIRHFIRSSSDRAIWILMMHFRKREDFHMADPAIKVSSRP
jgi:hypothetical protein